MGYQKRVVATLLGAVALVVLGGCATPKAGGREASVQSLLQPCAPNCKLTIELPADGGRPTLPPEQLTLVLDGGQPVDIEIPDEKTVPGIDNTQIYLIFERPAFRERGTQGRPGRPLFVVNLRQINNLDTMPASSCPPCGCKYTIVDFKNPAREPLDPWIILR